MKKGILIKRKEDGLQLDISLVDINAATTREELDQVYDLLDVSLIDIVSYKGTSIYLDDEGLLKLDPKLTMILGDTNQRLYGNLLIFGDVDEEGNTLGITEDAIATLNKSKILVQRSTGLQVLLW